MEKASTQKEHGHPKAFLQQSVTHMPHGPNELPWFAWVLLLASESEFPAYGNSRVYTRPAHRAEGGARARAPSKQNRKIVSLTPPFGTNCTHPRFGDKYLVGIRVGSFSQ